MDELVERLSRGEHRVEVSMRPEPSLEALKGQIDRGYVHIKFTETRGGTELGVRLDTAACDFSAANFDQGSGQARFEGSLTLNYVKVRCIATIDVATFVGIGRLEPIADTAAA